MKKQYLLLISIFYLCGSCVNQKTIRVRANESKFSIDVPIKFERSKVTDDHGHWELRLVYPDSSIIYVTNDEKSGGAINTFKAQKYGDGIYLKILSNDTLDISGEQGGLYWREKKEKDIVVGYIHIPKTKKQQYDEVLESLRKEY